LIIISSAQQRGVQILNNIYVGKKMFHIFNLCVPFIYWDFKNKVEPKCIVHKCEMCCWPKCELDTQLISRSKPVFCNLVEFSMTKITQNSISSTSKVKKLCHLKNTKMCTHSSCIDNSFI
jgi:hypothetical protein